MKKVLSLVVIVLTTVSFITSCNNNPKEPTLNEKAQKDMVSLFKSITKDSTVTIENITPYIDCDSIYCCTCIVKAETSDGTEQSVEFDYTLVKYKEDGKTVYYNYINNLNRPGQKRQDEWFKEYYQDENIKEQSKEFDTPEKFMMYMIYTGAEIQNRVMKSDYGL